MKKAIYLFIFAFSGLLWSQAKAETVYTFDTNAGLIESESQISVNASQFSNDADGLGSVY